MTDMTTWRAELAHRMTQDDDPGPVVAVAPDESALDVLFDGGYGTASGPEILVWTETRVYFPVTYDGAEWLESAPRNPQPAGQPHSGGQ